MRNVKYILIVLALVFGMTGCGDKSEKKTENINNTFSYYEEKEVAVADNGSFYYIGGYPYSYKSLKFLYFYDSNNNISYPLCSNASCKHNTTSCDACYLADECLGNAIWYYKERIYMIERGEEADILVSYDKTGYDKKTEAQLSVDGQSVIASSGLNTSCLSDGKLYYLVAGKHSTQFYVISLDNPTQQKCITTYDGNMMFSMSVRQGKLYINKLMDLGEDGYCYSLDCVNTSDYSVSEAAKYLNEISGVSGETFTEWCKGCYDNDDNFYFAADNNGDYTIYKLSISSKTIDEFYTFNIKGERKTSDNTGVDMLGFDGEHIIVYKGKNIYDRDENEDMNNYIYVMNTDKELVGQIALKKQEDGVSMGSNYILIKKYMGVIDGNIVLLISRFDVQGIDIPESWSDLYKQDIENKKNVDINIVISHNIAEKDTEGTGWKNITYKIDK